MDAGGNDVDELPKITTQSTTEMAQKQKEKKIKKEENRWDGSKQFTRKQLSSVYPCRFLHKPKANQTLGKHYLLIKKKQIISMGH